MASKKLLAIVLALMIVFIVLRCARDDSLKPGSAMHSGQENETEDMIMQDRPAAVDMPRADANRIATHDSEEGNESDRQNTWASGIKETYNDTATAADYERKSKSSDTAGMLIMFHNSRGPMCLQQLKYLESMTEKCPSLIIEQHLTTESGTADLLESMRQDYGASEGVSESFAYLPITFVNGHAYSGFNAKVADSMQKDILMICTR